jgi:hypothetical protein
MISKIKKTQIGEKKTQIGELVSKDVIIFDADKPIYSRFDMSMCYYKLKKNAIASKFKIKVPDLPLFFDHMATEAVYSDDGYWKWYNDSAIGLSHIERKLAVNFDINPNGNTGYKQNNTRLLYVMYLMIIAHLLNPDNIWNIVWVLNLPTRFTSDTQFLRTNFFDVITDILKTYGSTIQIKYACKRNLILPSSSYFRTADDELNYTCGRNISVQTEKNIIVISQSTSASNDRPLDGFPTIEKYDLLPEDKKFIVNEQICQLPEKEETVDMSAGGKYYTKFLKYSHKIKDLV